MKPWAVATGVLALCGAVATAGLLGMRASQTNAESASNALVLAERAWLSRLKPKTAHVPRSASPLPMGEASAAPARQRPDVQFRQTNTYNGAIVYVPMGCDGPYDVVMHFHGASTVVRDEAQQANINAVLAVFNAGNGAGKYSQAYQAGGTLRSLLRQIEMAVAPLCSGAGAKARRVALVGFSAGYAAVEKLLSRAEDRDRVDAALLADGLHAGFTNVWKRQMAPNALEAFRDFGELAKQGKKLFAITHSSIVTDGYASTTECSRFLLQALDVPCSDPLVTAQSGDFSIQGFTGSDKEAHMFQFRQMDATLLSKLRDRWSASAPR